MEAAPMLLIRFVVARIEILTNAFSLDFLGFGVYIFPAGEAGALIRTDAVGYHQTQCPFTTPTKYLYALHCVALRGATGTETN